MNEASSIPSPLTAAAPADLAETGALVRELRRAMNKTGEEFGELIGLSKGKVSELEAGKYSPGVAVAVAIEKLSDGRIDAAALSEDVRVARHAIRNNPEGAALSPGKTGDLSGGVAA